MQIILIIILIIFLTIGIAAVSFAPWVPARKKDLARIFALADLKPGEIFYDLGCGSGTTVFYAAKKFKAKAIGLEIGLPLYLYCKVRQLFVHNKNVTIKYKNLFKEDLSQADVVYFFGMPEKIKDKLRLKLEKKLKPGAKIISYVFEIEGWEPVEVSKPGKNDVGIYLYKI